MTRLEQIEKELKKLTRKVNCGIQFFDTFSEFPEEGRECALYIDKSTGDIYVYNGTEYVINNAGGGGDGGRYYQCGLTIDELDLTFISNQISTLGSYTIPTLYIGDDLSYETGDEIIIFLFNGEYLTGTIGGYDPSTGQATDILVTGVYGTGEDFLDCVNILSAYETGYVPYIGANQNVDLGTNNLSAYNLTSEGINTEGIVIDSELVIPRLTTVERDALSPAAGLVIFNTNTNKLEYFDGLNWQSGAILITTTGTLTTAGWSLVSGLYEQSVSDANITASSLVDIIPNNADIDIVTAAQILPRTDSAAGSVKVYAKNLPTANIGVTLNIWK